ncbi:MAG: hypothetical protein ACI9KE_005709 [Polyangiales bacterium]|jgi:hypothetical protein
MTLILVSCLAACDGSIGSSVDDPGTRPGPGPGVTLDCSELRPGRSPLRRLTINEYDNSVEYLFGDMSRPAERLIDDERGVVSADARIVSEVIAGQYMSAAEDISLRATEDLDGLLGCGGTNDEACVRGFIEDQGRLAYRRPVTSDETDALIAVFNVIAGEFDTRSGVRAVIESILQSPFFLYRVEIPAMDAGPIVRLTGYEVATRLSFLLLQTSPTDELLARAEAGELDTDEGVETVARELLDDAQASAAIESFFHHYLELDKLDGLTKDTETFPDYNEEIGRLFEAETEAFVAEILANEDGDWRELLTADWTMMNGALSEYYRLGDVTGDEFVRVPLDGRYHSGLITQGSITATRGRSDSTDPVHRGMFVRAKLLCGTIPDVPEGLQIEAPDPDPTLTYREQLEEHRANEECAVCHRLMDPLGFSMEFFGGDGRFREDDNGLVIDATGEILGSDSNGTFDGVPELAERVIASQEAQACFGEAFFEFGAGRALSDEDGCSLQSMLGSFSEGEFDIRELIIGLTQTEAFLHRVVDQDQFPAPPLSVEIDEMEME